MIGVSVFLIKENRITLGEKKIWIPLAIISVFIVIESVIHWDSESLTMICFAPCLMVFYSVGRALGMNILKYLLAFVVIQSLSCLVYSMMNLGEKTGGLLSSTNYALGCGFIGVVGFACLNVLPKKERLFLLIIMGIGMIFTGSAHLILITGLIGLAMAIRGDFSEAGLFYILAMVIVLFLWIQSPSGQEQYSRIHQVSEDAAEGTLEEENATDSSWGRGRLHSR